MSSVRSGIFSALSTQLISVGLIRGTGNLYNGEPAPLPLQEAPIIVLTVGEIETEEWSMGPSGKLLERYDLVLRMYLGPEDMDPDDAQAAQYDAADEFRKVLASITQPATLGVWNIGPMKGTHNLRTYSDAGEAPYIEYTVSIEELRARNDPVT